MNDFDDSEDYSSTYSSFRARSNTWPLNKPDLLINPNNVCIDETLPEIDLEDDDLFTTNENWSTGLVDHDIMSWNPILNAHNQHQQASIIHHHPQQQQQQQQQIVHQQQYESIPSNQRMIVKAQQPHEQQHQQTAQQQQINDPQLSVLNGVDSLEQTSGNAVPTNNQEDPNEYHIQQLHHLRLDNNPPIHQNHHHQQQQHYLTTSSTTTKICLQQQEQGSTPSTVTLETDCYNVFPDHHLHNHHHHHHLHHQPQHPHHHQLQPQSSAIYIDQEQPNDLDHVIKDEQLHRLDLDHHQQQHHQHLQHHQHQPESPDPNGHIQLHHMTSSSLSDHNAHHNNHSSSTYMLSSSLGTSGLGLSGDLEDLDYKQTTIDNQSAKVLYDAGDHIGLDHQHLQSSHQFLHQIHAGGSDSGGSGASMKQSNSTTSSKTKLNTPRRNAWGNMSYADLISQAINSTNDKRLTLSQIYDWMVQNVPYFKDKGDSNSSAGWKNSVRHNLSLHNRFKRLQNEGTGKSSWWTINPEADIGKCARRRAASMEASKYEKKRGRAKKNADAIRQSLISYPSLTN